MLRIDGSTTISACEVLLAKLANRPRVETAEVKVAHNLRHAHCGGLVSFVQLLVTWARLQGEAATVLPYVNGNAAAVVRGLVENLPGLAAVLVSATVSSGEANIDELARAAAHERLRGMNDGPLSATYKGPRVAMLCDDGSELRALRPLYHGSSDGIGLLRSEAEFEELADDLLEATVPSRRRDLAFNSEELGVFIRELFANTHDHARVDENGVPYARSLRGLYISHHLIRPEDIDAIASDYDPLRQFLRMSSYRRASVTTQFLEISIFDSGPGWAARVMRRAVMPDEDIGPEYAAVLRCFEDGFSTTKMFGRGMGLPRMLAHLKEQRGFIRLRTGRLSLYRSFATERGPLTEADRQLVDVSTGARPEQPRSYAAGAVITLLVPLRTRN
jgi:hypothetical protein